LSSFSVLFLNREGDFFNRLHDLKNCLHDSVEYTASVISISISVLFSPLVQDGKCNKISYIIIYNIYNNIKIIFTVFIRVMSGEFQTEIEIEMAVCKKLPTYLPTQLNFLIYNSLAQFM